MYMCVDKSDSKNCDEVLSSTSCGSEPVCPTIDVESSLHYLTYVSI
jgi:hypothetical protein